MALRHYIVLPFLATIRTENGNIFGGAMAALNNDNLEETVTSSPSFVD